MLIGGAMLVGALAGASFLLRSLDPPRNSPWEALAGLAMAAVVVLAYKAYKRWIERARDTEFALAGAPRELGLGLLAGFLLFSGMAGIVALMGGLEVQGVRGTGQLWSMLLMAFVSGTFEEALFRGLIQRHMEAMVGTWGALAFTSGLFGLAHIFNPDATWWSSLAIALEAGILLGAAWLLMRRLWLAVGLHAAWNFTQGWVFSIPVSGGDAPLGLLVTRRSGADWLTGGDFGLEASAVAMVIATLAGLLMLHRAGRRHGTVPPMWRRGRGHA
jgi:membrane protease YdiL (CAAX protease family)